MKWLANENIPLASVRLLQDRDIDIVSVLLSRPGIADREVLRWASQEQRIILTYDRDYGELIFHRKAPAPPGLVYFRGPPSHPEEPARFLLYWIERGVQFSGYLTVVTSQRIRQRPLP